MEVPRLQTAIYYVLAITSIEQNCLLFFQGENSFLFAKSAHQSGQTLFQIRRNKPTWMSVETQLHIPLGLKPASYNSFAYEFAKG